MIKKFNDVEIRSSAVIYQSTFEQIKKMYANNPEQAGELAVSAIELALTGQFSSDDFVIDLALTTMKSVVDKNKEKYEKKLEIQKQNKIDNQRLDRIAQLFCEGKSQKQIADIVSEENIQMNLDKISQQTVSKRLTLIRTDYPDLLSNYKGLQLLQPLQL